MPLVRVGWAVGPHGVKGALKFSYTTDHPEWLSSRATYLLSDPRTQEVLELTPVEVKTRGTDFTIKFAQYDAPEPLVDLKGWNLGYAARRGEVPRADPEDVYEFELPGMELRTPDGVLIAKVRQVRDSGAHTLLELDLPGEPLVPFIRQHVPEVNLAEGWMVCTYPLEEKV
jgi:16S rRNA processing protein RimM